MSLSAFSLSSASTAGGGGSGGGGGANGDMLLVFNPGETAAVVETKLLGCLPEKSKSNQPLKALPGGVGMGYGYGKGKKESLHACLINFHVCPQGAVESNTVFDSISS